MGSISPWLSACVSPVAVWETHSRVRHTCLGMSASLGEHGHMTKLTLRTVWLCMTALPTSSLVTGVVCAVSRVIELDFAAVVNLAGNVCSYDQDECRGDRGEYLRVSQYRRYSLVRGRRCRAMLQPFRSHLTSGEVRP